MASFLVLKLVTIHQKGFFLKKFLEPFSAHDCTVTAQICSGLDYSSINSLINTRESKLRPNVNDRMWIDTHKPRKLCRRP